MTLIIEIAAGVFLGMFLFTCLMEVACSSWDFYQPKSGSLPIEREYTFKIIDGVCRKVYVDEFNGYQQK